MLAKKYNMTYSPNNGCSWWSIMVESVKIHQQHKSKIIILAKTNSHTSPTPKAVFFRHWSCFAGWRFSAPRSTPRSNGVFWDDSPKIGQVSSLVALSRLQRRFFFELESTLSSPAKGWGEKVSLQAMKKHTTAMPQRERGTFFLFFFSLGRVHAVSPWSWWFWSKKFGKTSTLVLWTDLSAAAMTH